MTDRIALMSLQNTMSMKVCEEMGLPKGLCHLGARVSKPVYGPKNVAYVVFLQSQLALDSWYTRRVG